MVVKRFNLRDEDGRFSANGTTRSAEKNPVKSITLEKAVASLGGTRQPSKPLKGSPVKT